MGVLMADPPSAAAAVASPHALARESPPNTTACRRREHGLSGIGARKIAKSTGFPLGTVSAILSKSRQYRGWPVPAQSREAHGRIIGSQPPIDDTSTK